MANNIFENLALKSETEIFTSLLQDKNIHIERIVSYGHSSPVAQWYDQPEQEWVMLIKGEAQLEFEHGRRVNLTAGDYINISAHQKHRVSWTREDTETVWLAVHY